MLRFSLGWSLLIIIAYDVNCLILVCTIQLVETQSERRYGLGSILRLLCQSCGTINDIFTGKRHHNAKTKTMPIFDVNTKVAAGKLMITRMLH
jgi:low affinity Fe/Cu permease